jgi:hypothetical protein
MYYGKKTKLLAIVRVNLQTVFRSRIIWMRLRENFFDAAPDPVPKHCLQMHLYSMC